MGRGQLQGTPWHYEYAKGTGEKNSKNCAYNAGYCSHKYSQYHGQECAGKVYCEDFEHGVSSKAVGNISTNSNEKVKQPSPKGSNKKVKTQDLNKKKEPSVIKGAVKPGDKIVVKNCSTQEAIELNISDPKNPFVGKVLKQKVKIKNIVYEVDQINGKKQM